MLSNMQRPRKLLDEVRHAIRIRHYSYKTEKAYIHWIKRYILFHKKQHPKEMAEKEINEFLTYPAVNGKVSSFTQNLALCAVIFLYKHIIKKDIDDIGKIV